MPSVLHRRGDVVLRRPSARDRDEFVARVEASRRLYRRWAEPPADRNAFDDWVRRSRRRDFEALLICRADDGALVGGADLVQIVRGGFQNAYLGYFGFAPNLGRGHMTEGVGLALRHAFMTLGLHRIEANVQPGNEASIRLVERCGFRLEGFSPRYLKIGGRWRDHHRYAITVEDWRRHRRG